MTFLLRRLGIEKCVHDCEGFVFGFEATGKAENVASVVKTKALCGFDGETDAGTDSVEFICGDTDSFRAAADEDADGTRIVANDGGNSCCEDGVVVTWVECVSAKVFYF